MHVVEIGGSQFSYRRLSDVQRDVDSGFDAMFDWFGWDGKLNWLKWSPPHYYYSSRQGSHNEFGLLIPLYLLALPFVLFSTVYFFRAPLKRSAGQCENCGYDMRGIDDGATCPECGGKGTKAQRDTGTK